MSAHIDEPPMVALPSGQLREWTQVAMLIADAIARRRERLGRTGWSEGRQAEREFDRNVERAARPVPVVTASEDEIAVHQRADQPRTMAGRVAGQDDSNVSVEISQVGDRWLLHAVGHQPGEVPDVHAWVSCSSQDAASRLAENVVEADDPARVEALRDHAEFAARVRRTGTPGAANGGRARSHRDRTQDTDGNNDPGHDQNQDQGHGQGGNEEARGWTDRPAMREELEAVWSKETVDAVTAGRAWPAFARAMETAQREGHDLPALLVRMNHGMLGTSRARNPAALALHMFKKEVTAAEKSAAGEHIDMVFPDPGVDTTHRHDARDDHDAARSRNGDTADARDNWTANDHSVRSEDVAEWIAGLDSESYIDRVAADEVVGQFGPAVDQALGEKFPGILSPQQRWGDPVPAGDGRDDGADRAAQERDAAGQWAGQAKAWHSRADDDEQRAAAHWEQADDSEDLEVGREQDGLGALDAHDAAAERAAAAEAEGHEHAATARARTTATPRSTSSAGRSPQQGAPGGRNGTRGAGPRRSPQSPGQRPAGPRR